MDGDRQAERLVEELQRALAGSEQRLAVILDSLAEAVTIRGRDDRLIYANRAALAGSASTRWSSCAPPTRAS